MRSRETARRPVNVPSLMCRGLEQAHKAKNTAFSCTYQLSGLCCFLTTQAHHSVRPIYTMFCLMKTLQVLFS